MVLAAVDLRAQAGDSLHTADRYVLDYDVPEAPALVVANSSTSKILRAGAAKPAVASLVNSFLTGGDVDSGIAIDAAPYFLAGGRLRSIEEYRNDRWSRFWANWLVSIATVQSEEDTSSMRYGVGMRFTLLDDQDLLLNEALGDSIDEKLRASLPTAPRIDPRTGKVVRTARPAKVDLRDAYRWAEQKAIETPGHALSVAWGMTGLLKGGVARFDSLSGSRHAVWAAYRYRFARGMDLMSTVRYQESDSSASALLGGVALRILSPDYAVTGELYYESDPKGTHHGGLAGGASAEIEVLTGLRLVAALVQERDAQGVPKVRLRSTVRWAMTGER